MKRILFATLFTLITTTLTFAQTPTPTPQLYRVQVIKTNPGMSDEWREFYKNEILPVLKKGGVKQSTVLATSYGDAREYLIFSPLESLAQLDEPSALANWGQRPGGRST